jgi:putative transposase
MVGAGGADALGYHGVWCPTYRRPVLTGPVRDRLDTLIRQTCTAHDGPVVALEMEPGPVHRFVTAHPQHAPSSVATSLTGCTSPALRGAFPHLRSRLPALWSRSYVVVTVGAVSAETVRRYIDTRNERPWRTGAPR